mmetsp:Transcript_15228/g.29081  ORF Transcript_15228/g.29081 Transcript_15228/m.29081 type:complete len:204 (+) Transcript_15228:636-1247(+)
MNEVFPVEKGSPAKSSGPVPLPPPRLASLPLVSPPLLPPPIAPRPFILPPNAISPKGPPKNIDCAPESCTGSQLTSLERFGSEAPITLETSVSKRSSTMASETSVPDSNKLLILREWNARNLLTRSELSMILSASCSASLPIRFNDGSSELSVTTVSPGKAFIWPTTLRTTSGFWASAFNRLDFSISNWQTFLQSSSLLLSSM